MTDSPRPSLRRTLLGLAAACAALTASCQSLPPVTDDAGADDCPACRTCPGCTAEVCKNPTMMALAHDLDCLDRHIDRYGSVVVKQPDVWGQARLTKYREEFEAQMQLDLNQFQERLQGSVNRQDQAFFADALSLSAAVSGPGAVTRYPAGTQASATNPTTVSAVALSPPPTGPATVAGNAPSQGSSSTTPQDLLNLNVFGNPVQLPGNAPAFVSTLAAPSVSGTQGQVLGIGLEPTIVLEQKARYLNYLNQIRRTNEGDDTADSPGYSLNLVRVPVSVLPGKKTRIGHAAEVTVTLSPVLGDDLLPVSFRNLVVNDLVDQIGVPLTAFLNDKADSDRYLNDCMEKIVHDLAGNGLTETEIIYIQKHCLQQPLDPCAAAPCPPPKAGAVDVLAVSAEVKTALLQNLQASRLCTVPAVSSSKRRNAQLPFPPSEMLDVYGVDFAFRIAYAAKQTFAKDPANRDYVHLPDVQSFLKEELQAAYEFLAQPQNQDFWSFCDQDLANAVRSRQALELQRRQLDFAARFLERSGGAQAAQDSVTPALAWAVIVESALLNDHLVRDMKETASAKGCCLCGDWKPYYLPAPPDDARQSFNEYVRCRWPIHVFALDPQVEEQNLADQDTTRREMQLALSLAFVSGQMSGNNLTRYARRLDAQYDTISLNRTAVGFSHGEDTFGWRFYPRFQTPDTESNAQVFFRDMLIGGPTKDQLLRERQLEPGVRDCVAIVMMPSFVPYLTADVSSDWVNLTDPKCKELDCKETLRLSRSVKAIQNCACGVQDADCYRDGELGRLLRKADQLSARLPLQTLSVQVPYENTLGGFQMFSSGVTDLAPELYGWYGAPYVRVDAPTTLFLMGNHFSIKQTRVIAGGVPVDNRWPIGAPGTMLPSLPTQELLSRQVLRVTIPPGAQTIESNGRFFVDVQVATPYGATSHLLIPAVSYPSALATGWKTTTTTVGYVFDGTAKAFVPGAPPPDAQDLLALIIQPNLPDFATANVTLTVAAPYPGAAVVVKAAFDSKQHLLTIKNADLAAALLTQLKTNIGIDPKAPPPTLGLASAQVDPLDSAGKSLGLQIVINGPLAVFWRETPAIPKGP